MKKKDLEKIKDKSAKDLQKEAVAEKNNIAKLILEQRVNPPKDSNLIKKEKIKLAAILTIINEKKIQKTV